GPVAAEKRWHAQANEGFDSTAFVIDWEAQQARCPQGHLRQKWQGRAGPQTPGLHLRLSRPACRAGPVRSTGTPSATVPRALMIYLQPTFAARHAANGSGNRKRPSGTTLRVGWALKSRWRKATPARTYATPGVSGWPNPICTSCVQPWP